MVSKVTMPCYTCKATGVMLENRFDTDTANVWATLPIRVVRTTGAPTFNMQFMGYGYIVSVTDYGRHRTLTDEQLIYAVHHEGYKPQFCNYVAEDGTVASEVIITTNKDGYTVKGVFAHDRSIAQAG
jgi:hypothetical protein